jgi:CTP synthase (UTP-ammonia lyase)
VPGADVKNPIRVALIGDFSNGVRAHTAIPDALNLAAAELGASVHVSWMATSHLQHNAADKLDGFQGIWCVPGSPYASLDGALNAIRFARVHGCPFLGTCGGFQHALIEYARNVLGLANADHAESNPATSLPFVARLACSLSGGEGTVTLEPASRAFSIYGASETTERYNCNFGFNSGYRSLLEGGRMRVAGVDGAGEVRIVELDGHPFYIATLFQPELRALDILNVTINNDHNPPERWLAIHFQRNGDYSESPDVIWPLSDQAFRHIFESIMREMRQIQQVYLDRRQGKSE